MNTHELTWPAERFYWAVLDLPGYTRRGPLPMALLLELQPHMPLDVSELHAVAIPHPSSRSSVLVCAARRDELGAVDASATSLTPTLDADSALRSQLPLDAADVASLNLLSGAFEPRPIRRARLRRQLELVAAMLLVSILIILGLHRRTANLDVETSHATQSLAAVLADRPPSPSDRSSLLPASAIDTAHATESLNAQIRLVAGVEHAAKRVTAPTDAASPLAALLRAWPAGLDDAPCTVQSISVNGASMTLSFTTDADPLVVIRALIAPPGWKLEEPRVSRGGGGTTARVMLELRRVGGGAGERGAP